MTSKLLIAVGLTWFVAALLWMCWGFEFSFAWRHEQVALVVGVYVSMFLYLLFLIGWLVPLGWGVYRLVRQR